jgi:hypothetical protein
MFASRRVAAWPSLFLLAATLGTAGCEKKAAEGVAADPQSRGMPPLQEPEKEIVEVMRKRIGAEAPPAEHPSAAPAPSAAMPPGHPPIGAAAAAPDEKIDPNNVLAGVLRLDDKVKAKVAKGDTVFLVARSATPDGTPGPILAVKKLSVDAWPLSFRLDGHDAMMVGTKLAGKVVITARVDKDGDAMTKNPGDVTGVSRALDVPASKVVITLDTVM